MTDTNNEKSVVYKITNPSGRIYVGKTKHFTKRMLYYKNANCKTQPVLLKSILKHGWEAHSVEIIEEVLISEADDREKYWINEYKCNLSRHPNNNGMNCTDGGDGQCGRKLSEDAKRRIGDANKGNTYRRGCKMPSHVMDILLKANIGRKQSKEHQEKKALTRVLSGKSLPCVVHSHKTGEFIGEYRSITEACNDLNISEVRNRAYQVANGVKNRNQTKGYVFKYKDT